MRLILASLALLCGTLAACADTNGMYCQSGPKYGTQCYANGNPSAGTPPSAQPPESNESSSSKTSNLYR